MIGKINDDQNHIATAVDEQTRTTAVIVSSVDELRQTAEEINSSLAGIGASASSTAEGAAETRQSATTLIATARELNRQIGLFSY